MNTPFQIGWHPSKADSVIVTIRIGGRKQSFEVRDPVFIGANIKEGELSARDWWSNHEGGPSETVLDAPAMSRIETAPITDDDIVTLAPHLGDPVLDAIVDPRD